MYYDIFTFNPQFRVGNELSRQKLQSMIQFDGLTHVSFGLMFKIESIYMGSRCSNIQLDGLFLVAVPKA